MLSPSLATRNLMKMIPRSHHKQGFSLIELMVAVVVLGVVSTLVYPTIKPLLQQSVKVEASAVASAYQAYLEENLSALEPWLPYSVQLKDASLPPKLSLELGSVLLANHPRSNPLYLDRGGAPCVPKGGDSCFLKVELEIKNFGTTATPLLKYAYRISSTNTSGLKVHIGARGEGDFEDNDYTNQVPDSAYRNTDQAACVGRGVFVHAMDLATMNPQCVYATDRQCADDEVPTGYKVVTSIGSTSTFEIEWVCTKSRKLKCPDGYVLSAINPRQFLAAGVTKKSVCAFGGAAKLDMGEGGICPLNYISKVSSSGGVDTTICEAPPNVDATESL
jgi:prepilin-type N-terminal cleavage/methylation domain-containing protein